MSDEIPLLGGWVNVGVVRVGDTVRRPIGPNSPFVHELLDHLERVGFDSAPRFLGIDDLGREIVSFLPGSPAARRRRDHAHPAGESTRSAAAPEATTASGPRPARPEGRHSAV